MLWWLLRQTANEKAPFEALFYFTYPKAYPKNSLDFKSSWIQRICFLPAVHGTAAFWILLLEASHTPPLVDFSQPTPHRTPTPQNSFGSHPATFTPCAAQTITRFYEHVLTETTFQFQPALGISKIVLPRLSALLGVIALLKNKSYCWLESLVTIFASSNVKDFLSLDFSGSTN